MDILVRSWEDLGKILTKILQSRCQKLQDVIVGSYQDKHVSKKTLTKKPEMSGKILQRNRRWQDKFDTKCLISRKNQNQKIFERKVIEK